MSATVPMESAAIDGIGGAEALGDLLRHLRWREGAGQHVMATRLGFNPNYLGSVERGESRNPQLATLARLAFGFDISIGPLAAAFVRRPDSGQRLPRTGARRKGAQPGGDAVALGAAIRFVRRRAGLTQTEFADRTGMHRSYVSALEIGERGSTGMVTLTRFMHGVLGDDVSLETLAEGVADLAMIYTGEIDLHDLTTRTARWPVAERRI
jgi:transcriptional regulator with XRE-family HTH domain